MARRWLVVGILVAFTGGLGAFAAKVGIDNSVDVWFVEGDPSLVSYHAFQKTFGNDEVVAIAIEDPAGIWRPDALNTLQKVSNGLEAIKGVSQVIGLPTTRLVDMRAPEQSSDDLIKADADLVVEPAMPGPMDAASTTALRRRVESDLLLRDRLVVADGKVAMLYAVMDRMSDIDAQRDGVLTNIDKVLNDTLPKDTARHVAGIGVVYNALNVISQTEGALFMGLSFLIIFLLLWPLFRSGWAVLTAIGAVAAAVAMTKGIYGLTGHNDNMVTMTLPVLVLILGVADCVHILRHRAAHPDAPPERVLAEIIRPCLFTTLTTMVGFGALATSRMAVVRDLGIFAAIGIGLAFVCSVAACSVAMSFPSFRLRRPSDEHNGLFGRCLAATARVACNRKEAVLGVCALVLLLSAYGVSRINVDTYSLGFLSASHPVRADSEAMERKVGPFTPLELVVRPRKPAEAAKEWAVSDPAALQGVEKMSAALLADKALKGKVRDVFSLADISRRIAQLERPGAPAAVPGDAGTLGADLSPFLNNPDNRPDRLVTFEKDALRVTLSVPVLTAQGYEALIKDVQRVADDTLPASVVAEPNGYLPLYVKMMKYVVESQVQSFGIAFVVVFILIGILFRSLKMTALAVLPNVLPVFVTLGVMGFFGIDLDVATVTITAIIIGIVVDDTIHYLHRFRAELARADGDFEEATHHTALGVGRSIGATTLIFAAGFSLLAFASVKSIVFFGLLTALAMVVALVGDLFVLPAVLLALRPRLLGGGDPPDEPTG